MHNAAFRATDRAAAYLPFPLPRNGFRDGLERHIRDGAVGLNVTNPFKEEAAATVGTLTAEAADVGSVNAIRVDGGKTVGTNTDGEGLLRDLTHAGWPVADRRIALLGAGGAARAVAMTLGRAGAAHISVYARTPEAVDWLPDERFRAIGWSTLSDAKRNDLAASDLIIQATSLGRDGRSAPGVDWGAVRPETRVVDLLYAPRRTPFLEQAATHRCQTRNGLGMLVYQGVLTFEFWTRTPAPVEVMANAVDFDLRAANHD